MTKEQLKKVRELRWKCRTDLLFLSQIILGEEYHMEEKTHRPVCNHLQQFPTPNEEEFVENDQYINGKWVYRPIKKMVDLPGARRMLLLDSRGFSKSTLNCVAHSIQWVLNYPNVALLIVQANLMKVQTVIKGIKAPFQYNETFRALFPEHCPQGKVDDWGTMDRFTTMARTDKNRREPTILGLSLDAGAAGLHFHVMKFSDIVEQDNSRNLDQSNKVIGSFQMFRNLLDRPDYWIDVEGTRYSYADLYGSIIDANVTRIKNGKPAEWKIFARGCYRKDVSSLDEGLRKEPKFTPDELDCPDLLDAKGQPVSNWPEKFSVEFLEAERTDPVTPDSEIIFATQRRNNPLDVKDTAQTFDPRKFTVISRENYRKIPLAYRQVTVDTASTQKVRSNYTAITIGAWSKNGKLYIEDIIHGKFLPEEIVFHLFNCAKRYSSPSERPQMYFIEKTSYVEGLMPTINRAQDTGKLYIPDSLKEKYGKEWNVGDIRLPITLLPRETTISKQDRIRFSLQSPYSNGDLIFLDDISCLDYARQEFSKFPQFHTDDIIDTIADQFQEKEYFGRLAARKQTFEEFNRLNYNHQDEIDVYGEPLGQHLVPTPYSTNRWGDL